jgi:hypothetical protein
MGKSMLAIKANINVYDIIVSPTGINRIAFLFSSTNFKKVKTGYLTFRA